MDRIEATAAVRALIDRKVREGYAYQWWVELDGPRLQMILDVLEPPDPPALARVESLRREWQRQARNLLPGRDTAFHRYEEARAALLDAAGDPEGSPDLTSPKALDHLRRALCTHGDGTWRCWDGGGRTPAGMFHPECVAVALADWARRA